MLYFLLNLNLRIFKNEATGNKIILTKSLQMKSTWNQTKAKDVYSCVLSARQIQYTKCMAPTFNELKIYLRIHNNYKSNTRVKRKLGDYLLLFTLQEVQKIRQECLFSQKQEPAKLPKLEKQKF